MPTKCLKISALFILKSANCDCISFVFAVISKEIFVSYVFSYQKAIVCMILIM